MQNSNNDLRTTLVGLRSVILLVSMSGLFSNGIQFCVSDTLLLWGPDPSIWSHSKCLFVVLFFIVNASLELTL